MASRHSPTPRGSRGFTLVEAVVVLALSAVLLALATPSFLQLRERMAALAAFNELTLGLAQARMAAIQYGHPVTVCPSADGLSCRQDLVWDEGWLVFRDAARTGEPNPALGAMWVVRRVPGPVAIRGTVGRHRVRYQPTGLSGGNNVSLRFCSRRSGLHLGSVVVNLAGRVRHGRPEGAGAPCPFALD